MSADELGSIWSSDPVRITQSIKPAGKELDREEQKRQEHHQEPEREPDKVELSSKADPDDNPKNSVVKKNTQTILDISGSHIDVTVE